MENKNESLDPDLISKILSNIQDDMVDEEIIHLLLEQKISANVHEEYTFGQRAADKLAGFAGSWKFVGIFGFLLALWICFNSFVSSPFDAFPFILLNLFLSCIAAIQAPLIMMSQNRSEQKDRMRSENDYKVNLKTEIIIEDLHKKIDDLKENQEKILTYLKSVE